jgi:hypothetical protein
LPPVGFWSYARQDDELSQGKLTSLRSLLMFELQQQHGRDQIQIFQDARTIPHGAAWEREIKTALGQSTFFIPIVTPNFVQSEWCCREVTLFLEREAELYKLHPGLAQRSRIFPVQFIDIEDVDPADPAALAALQSLQWFDFRRFRHRSYESEAVREAIADLAGSIRDLLKMRVSPAGDEAPRRPPAAAEPPPPEEAREVSHAPTVIIPPEPPPEAARPAPPPLPPAARPIEVGDVLNHMFEVKRFIKAGGMGQVFEGSNVITGERVAIKTLLPALAADPKVIAMLHRESITLTRLQHEALVQYRVLAKEPQLGVLYIVTEYIDGVDLGDVLERVDRSPTALAALLKRLASGLAAAHKLGAIHRDMSPDNVMLPGGDLQQAKIIDFGIAKDLAGTLPTIIGDGFAGKLNFVAPEQLGEHGGEIGSWTDVYSLALVILSAAKGEKVDMAGSFADAIRKRRDGPDLSSAPESLRPLLADMLRLDPAERLRTMDEVIARLAPKIARPPPVAIPAPEAEEAQAAAARVKAERRAEAKARRDAEKQAAKRAEDERRDAERREAERRDAERREAERQDAERREAERRKAEQRAEQERQEAEREAERKQRAAELAAVAAAQHSVYADEPWEAQQSWEAEEPWTEAARGPRLKLWVPLGLGVVALIAAIILLLPKAETSGALADGSGAASGFSGAPAENADWLGGRWGTTETCSLIVTIAAAPDSIRVSFPGRRPVTHMIRSATSLLVTTESGNSYQRSGPSAGWIDVEEGGIPYRLWRCS